MIGRYLIDLVDEAGYLPPDLGDVGERLSATDEQVSSVLATLQTFDPPGICARSLSECLAIQLREHNRFDPAMKALVDNLELLARRDLAGLRKVCGVDDEDLIEMIDEIRRLDPKPGLKFGSTRLQSVAPDVFVRPGPGGGWLVELNSDTLPKVLVNQTYYTELAGTIRKGEDKSYFADCLQNATVAGPRARPARSHHPESRDRDRAPAGRLLHPWRVASATAQLEGRRRRDPDA